MQTVVPQFFRRFFPGIQLLLSLLFIGLSSTLSAQCFADGGTLSLEDGSNINIICAGDGISDAFTPIVEGASGDNFAWVITSAGGNILAVPPAPPFDLEGEGPGACFIWYIAYADGFTGNIAVGANICEYTEDDGCFDISNHITVNRQTGEDCGSLECTALSSEIALNDGSTSNPLDIVMSGDFAGQNTTFIITDITGTILAIPGGTGPFDLDGAGPGTCVIWYLAYDDGLEGLAVNESADDLIGCFDLSNGVVVQRDEAQAGDIALATGGTSASICVDGTPDPLTVVMSGDAAGDNSTFFITDAVTGEILAVPGNNGPFDLDGAGIGVCEIWYLSSFGDVTGVTMGASINDIDGCFDLSNPIVVTREDCCMLDAGNIFTDATTPSNIVVVANRATANISVIDASSNELIGNFDFPDGGQPMYVVHNETNNTALVGDYEGRVIAYDASTFEVTGQVAVGEGVFHMWMSNDRQQLWTNNEIDRNISAVNPTTLENLGTIELPTDLFDLGYRPHDVIFSPDNQSAFVTVLNTLEQDFVIRYDVATRTETHRVGVGLDPHVSLTDANDLIYVAAQFSDELIVFNRADLTEVTRFEIPTAHGLGMAPDGSHLYIGNIGNGGDSAIYTLELATNTIIGEPVDAPNSVPHNLAVIGDQLYLTHSGNANTAVSVYNLTPTPVFERTITAGNNPFGLAAFSTVTTTDVSICIDDEADPITVTMDGTGSGPNSSFFITDAMSGEILAVPGNNGPFDLNGAGGGVCEIWYIVYEDGLTGLGMGSNIDDLDGCFDLSNAITVTRNVTDGGGIALADGSTETSICVDGVGDPIEVIRDGNATGSNRTFIITDANSGEILGIPGNDGPFDLDGAGDGVCEIWYLAYEDGLEGLAMGNNITDLEGCYDLSNPVTVIRQSPDGGTVATTGGATEFTACAGDVVVPVSFSTTATALSYWYVITDADDNILESMNSIGVTELDLSGAPAGECHIWGWSYRGEGDPVPGENISSLTDGDCETISTNFITVTRLGADAGAIALDGGAVEATICADGTPDPLTVVMSGDAAGDNSTCLRNLVPLRLRRRDRCNHGQQHQRHRWMF